MKCDITNLILLLSTLSIYLLECSASTIDGSTLSRNHPPKTIESSADLMSDEPDDLQQCEPNEFKCDNGECIEGEWRCDGSDDCEDSSDERNCSIPSPDPQECEPNEFKCDNGKCIKGEWRCDGNDDCENSSDERNCSIPLPDPQECEPNEFKCDNGKCIKGEWRCDGNDDCEDSSDERSCSISSPDPQECEPNEFQCDSGICINKNWLCDGVDNCEDLSDERNCASLPRKCNDDEFTCDDQYCIPRSGICDSIPDCEDYSDEIGCPTEQSKPDLNKELNNTVFVTIPSKCEPNEFRCANGECILKIYRCDSEYDCKDKSDEYNCPSKPHDWRCSYDEFKCASGRQCISKSFHCDFERDCYDGSDESGCFQPSIFKPPPSFVNLNIGETFYITCSTIGNPTPEVIWRLNGGHVPASCTSTSANGVGTLTCINVQLSDQGTYSCEPHNVKGLSTYIPKTILKLENLLPRNV